MKLKKFVLENLLHAGTLQDRVCCVRRGPFCNEGGGVSSQEPMSAARRAKSMRKLQGSGAQRERVEI